MNRELTEAEIAYIAGIIDGEGSISFSYRPRGIVVPLVQVSNTHLALIEWLGAAISGGSICIDYGRKRRPAHHKPTHMWRCSGAVARELVSIIQPHLIVKRRQADLLLSLHEEVGIGLGQGAHHRWHIRTDDEVLAIEAAVDKMRFFNRKGVVAA